MLKNNKNTISLHNSTIMAQDNLHFINPEQQLLLNRTSLHKELVFNPMLTYSGKLDANFFQKWIPVKQCYYQN